VGADGPLHRRATETWPLGADWPKHVWVFSAELVPLVPLLLALAPTPAFVPPAARLHAMTLASIHIVHGLPEPCPGDMVLVDGDFCPGLEYECQRFVDARAPSCAEYARKPECRYNQVSKRFCIDQHEWPNRIGEPPTVFVTWREARSLCESVGKRLCERAEWTLACEGPKRAPYPYGWERNPSPCNLGRPPIDFEPEELVDPRSRAAEVQRLWQADAIGSHPDCVSPFGAFDMVGNVDEWTDNSGEGGGSADISTLSGGYWGPVRNTCRLATKTHGPDFSYYKIGFRCCADPRDGVRPAPPPPHQPRWVLEQRQGPDGWPVPNGQNWEAPSAGRQLGD
jgi:hypothetical protein